MMANASNFSFHSKSINFSQDSHSFANMRLRSWVNLGSFQADGYGLYTQFELGHVPFETNNDGPISSSMNGFDGLELRRSFFWFMLDDNTQVRFGLQGWSDMFSNSISKGSDLYAIDDYDFASSILANSVWDFNVPGLNVFGSFDDSTHYRMGVFALSEGDRTLSGNGSAYLIAADYDQGFDGHRMGASVYYLADKGDYSYGTFGGPQTAYGSSQDLWIGLRGAFQLDNWDPTYALIYNRGGTSDPNWDHQGWAGKLEMSRGLGEGKVSLLAMASTGDDGSGESNEFRTIAQGARDNLGSQGYWGYLPITSPHGPSDVNDLGISLQNQGLGLLTMQGAWAQPITGHLDSVVAMGYLASAEKNPMSGHRDLGSEVALMMNWKPRPMVGIQFGIAYLFAGGFFDGPGGGSSDDLREIFLRMQLEF